MSPLTSSERNFSRPVTVHQAELSRARVAYCAAPPFVDLLACICPKSSDVQATLTSNGIRTLKLIPAKFPEHDVEPPRESEATSAPERAAAGRGIHVCTRSGYRILRQTERGGSATTERPSARIWQSADPRRNVRELGRHAGSGRPAGCGNQL